MGAESELQKIVDKIREMWSI